MSRRGWTVLSTALVIGAFLWAYFPVLVQLVERWTNNPLYSHGYLVPAFSAFLLYSRRKTLANETFKTNSIGFGVIATGLIVHYLGSCYYMETISAIAIPIVILGITFTVGGIAAVRWAWPSVLYLIFLAPAPFYVEQMLARPLQSLAANVSVYLFQALGLIAISAGNTIILNATQLEIVDACNGLGMLVTFAALITGIAIAVPSTLYEKAALLISFVPIALLSNVIRILLTGILCELTGNPNWVEFFHDFAGWIMMPVALFLSWLVIMTVRWLIIEVDSASDRPEGFLSELLVAPHPASATPPKAHSGVVK